MRIRSIKPKFWRSDDIDKLDWHSRLVFIGLWSYVDDNGVGRDRISDIAADLFAGDLVRDAHETFARVSKALDKLSEGGQVVRYTVDGKAYLFITSWGEHQKIDHPNNTRYPLPTSANTTPPDGAAKSSRTPRDILSPGEEEKGSTNYSSGKPDAVERSKQASTPKRPAPSRVKNTGDEEFDTFWAAYPRKEAKADARKAWVQMTKKFTPAVILEGLSRFRFKDDPQYVPLPASWLRGERWNDEPATPGGRHLSVVAVDGQEPSLSKADVDGVLGPDYWQPSAPPEEHAEDPRAWMREQLRLHQAERVQKALKVLQSRSVGAR